MSKNGKLMVTRVDGALRLIGDADLCDCECGNGEPPGPGTGGCDPASTTFYAVGFNGRVYTKYTDATVPDFSDGTDFDGGFGATSVSDEVWYSNDGGIEEWVWVEDDQNTCPDGAGVYYRTYGWDTNTNTPLQSTSTCCEDAWNAVSGRYEIGGDTVPEAQP